MQIKLLIDGQEEAFFRDFKVVVEDVLLPDVAGDGDSTESPAQLRFTFTPGGLVREVVDKAAGEVADVTCLTYRKLAEL